MAASIQTTVCTTMSSRRRVDIRIGGLRGLQAPFGWHALVVWKRVRWCRGRIIVKFAGPWTIIKSIDDLTFRHSQRGVRSHRRVALKMAVVGHQPFEPRAAHYCNANQGDHQQEYQTKKQDNTKKPDKRAHRMRLSHVSYATLLWRCRVLVGIRPAGSSSG